MSSERQLRRSDSSRQTEQSTDEYGRGGPFPKDVEHFDPLNGSPPGNWRLTTHSVGGNSDIPGTRREKATWEHPFFGELSVTGQQPSESFDDKEFTIDCSEQIESVCETDVQPDLEREVAYDLAVEMMMEVNTQIQYLGFLNR
jgi:hypothetical protein